MDASKIDQARSLFSQYETLLEHHNLAIKEYEALTNQIFEGKWSVKPKELNQAIRQVLTDHFGMLKEELEAEIQAL